MTLFSKNIAIVACMWISPLIAKIKESVLKKRTKGQYSQWNVEPTGFEYN